MFDKVYNAHILDFLAQKCVDMIPSVGYSEARHRFTCLKFHERVKVAKLCLN